MKWIYKITYPNGKIFVGKDLTGSINFFGTAESETVEQDFSFEEIMSFTIKRDLLWWSTEASDDELNQKELEFISSLDSHNPSIGYNRWPLPSQ